MNKKDTDTDTECRRIGEKSYSKQNCESNAKDEVRKGNWTIDSKGEYDSPSAKIGAKVMMYLCQHVLDDRGMPDKWKTSVIVSILKGKGDGMSCGLYRKAKLLEYAMKIVEKVLERHI